MSTAASLQLVPADKTTFLIAIAEVDAVMDGRHQRPDVDADVATVFRLRTGDVVGQVIDNPRLPLTRPARYFLKQEKP